MGCVLLGLATNTCTGRDQCQLQDGARHGDAADSRAHVATPTAPPGHGLKSGLLIGVSALEDLIFTIKKGGKKCMFKHKKD